MIVKLCISVELMLVSSTIVAFSDTLSLAVGALGMESKERSTLTVNVSTLVGELDGDAVGSADRVGNALGLVVGRIVGRDVGFIVGRNEGCDVGDPVGPLLGAGDGTKGNRFRNI